MQAAGRGFLAIWSDVLPETETDYLHWLTREHTGERLGVAGFCNVRVFRARSPDIRRYFIFYRLDSPATLASAGYLERLNAPSKWSQRIMSTLQNFVRGGGAIVEERGRGQGAAILPLICRSADLTSLRQALDALGRCDRIVAIRILEVDQAATLIPTTEKAIRADDRSFGALLLLEGLDHTSLRDAQRVLDAATQIAGPEALTYDQIYSLDRSETP